LFGKDNSEYLPPAPLQRGIIEVLPHTLKSSPTRGEEEYGEKKII